MTASAPREGRIDPAGRSFPRGEAIRFALLALSFFFATVVVALVITGGFATSLFGVRVSARSPVPAGVAATVSLAWWAVAAMRAQSSRRDLVRSAAAVDRHASLVILIISLSCGAAALAFGTFSASGADASGYLSEAAMLARGALVHIEPLAAMADWPDAPGTLMPLGWTTMREAGAQAPTYAVGLPLLMALPHALGGPIAASAIVAVAYAIAVGATGSIARHLAGGVAGILAAVWFATGPAAFGLAIQPMSDVPVTGAWMVCWLMLARAGRVGQVGRVGRVGRVGVAGQVLSAGIAAAVAVLIRPNLAPLAAIPALWIVVSRRGTPRVWRDSMAFSLPVAAAGGVIAWLQWYWFGSPLRSGYGTASDLFAWSNVAPNVSLYTGWLLETHGPWLLAAPFALWLRGVAILRWMIGFAALVVGAYLVYFTFDNWMYLRFLLPSLSVAAIAVSCLIAAALRRGPVWTLAVVAIVVLGVSGMQIEAAKDRYVFDLSVSNARAPLAGHYLESATPDRAVLVSGEQSGAMRYYTGRSILRWDGLDPPVLAQAIARIEAHGHDVWIVLDDWEAPRFRERFQQLPFGALDWPPRVNTAGVPHILAWRLADRERFANGQWVITDRLRVW